MTHTGMIFFERPFPSANMVLINGEHPVLVDTGFGSDAEETVRLIRDAGVDPGDLQLIINTHDHSDHSGGNFYLQQQFGTKVAAHRYDAELVNAGDPDVGNAEWLDQPIEPYRVDPVLTDGDKIRAGSSHLEILHTPGHSAGHISLYEPDEKILIAGDLFHRNDVGWLDTVREGESAIRRSLESLDRLSALEIRKAYSGHGPEIGDPEKAIDGARSRLEKWLQNPEKAFWHACKRIFAFTLIMKDGLPEEEVGHYLMECGWFRNFSDSFGAEPESFVRELSDEMTRSGGAVRKEGRLIASAPYRKPPADWAWVMPRDWPARKSMNLRVHDE